MCVVEGGIVEFTNRSGKSPTCLDVVIVSKHMLIANLSQFVANAAMFSQALDIVSFL